MWYWFAYCSPIFREKKFVTQGSAVFLFCSDYKFEVAFQSITIKLDTKYSCIGQYVTYQSLEIFNQALLTLSTRGSFVYTCCPCSRGSRLTICIILSEHKFLFFHRVAIYWKVGTYLLKSWAIKAEIHWSSALKLFTNTVLAHQTLIKSSCKPMCVNTAHIKAYNTRLLLIPWIYTLFVALCVFYDLIRLCIVYETKL